jgi:phosphoribosylaminoimidazolecarboxamide formyltransferase/IMP cyclohydrolase
MTTSHIKRALISVSDKTGVVDLALKLKGFGVEIISSGGTRKVLEENGIEVTPIEDITGNPEAFGGRMKTLSFQVLSSLLFRRGHNGDEQTAKALGIVPIDLVVCHLYPFQEVLKKQGPLDELIENIDIGGPTMLRAAAKNFISVTVCPDPKYYSELKDVLDTNNGQVSADFRQIMALRTFRHCASYDAMITAELEKRFQDTHRSVFISTQDSEQIRYGENPQQNAWFHASRADDKFGEVLQGKAMSYNNLWDADQAFRCARDLLSLEPEKFGCVVVKHANPCGLGLANESINSLTDAWASDPISSFGSIICFTKEVDEQTALFFKDKFVEVVMAPTFTPAALNVFSKKKNLRLIRKAFHENPDEVMIRSVDKGFLIQDEDPFPGEELDWVSEIRPTQKDDELWRFGLVAGKHLRSNAIALVKRVEGRVRLIGAGMGNPNRVVSVKQAFEKAQEEGHSDFKEAVLVSDAFFPFDDNIKLAHSYGVETFIQPGGSLRDPDVLKTVKELGLKMAMTQTRHFRH